MNNLVNNKDRRGQQSTMRCNYWNAFPIIASLLLTYTWCTLSPQPRNQSPGQLNLERIDSPQGAFLAPLLIPRAPGTEGSRRVREFLRSVYRQLGWQEQVIVFTANTPRGPIEMANLVFTKNPSAPQRIVLAAHYDSKITAVGQSADYQFVGATDSAAPCAMIIELSYALDAVWNATETTLQAVFFDGEEAIANWTATDSLYGSRQLATLWSRTGQLSGIRLFILLDLLGAPNPRIPIYNKTTEPVFRLLMQTEAALRTRNLVHRDPSTRLIGSYFAYMRPMSDAISVLDDHVPFHDVGVRAILHLIPSPFPRVWHRITDDGNALDGATIGDLTLILYHSLLNVWEAL